MIYKLFDEFSVKNMKQKLIVILIINIECIIHNSQE